ncbi:sensor histidine kinase [Nonomuraea rhizosphaerae]|uniref:sensor histidine kinase n=1 Tax=Nonomuraea rhizosphaerae TaxID=2665663 RepID=UPI001C5F2F23|nr:sensor histidine kinase [Nonomuraea rhizosphaerae]
MGSPVEARAENVWLRSYPFWDAYFAVVLVATVFVVMLDDGPLLAVGLLLLLGVVYVLVGRRAVRADDVPVRESWWYAAVALILVTGAVVLAPPAAIALSALVPMAFMSLRVPHAVWLTAGFLATPALVGLREGGAGWWSVVLVMAVGLCAAGVLGTFIGRLYTQNHERARLIEELDRTREELAAVSREAGVLAERERLAGEIHDTLAQGFTSIITLLQAAQATRPDPPADAAQAAQAGRQLELAEKTARENLAETRALIAALAPPALDGASLGQALDRLAEGFEVPLEVSVTGEPVTLPAAVEMVLVRAAQEGLTNVRKHARARSARLALVYGDEGVRLSVSDDGEGFAPFAARDGYGLRAMRARVSQLGGIVTVDAAAGAGTTVTVALPCVP